jgi:predicted enzyme related to lactoylglutathione lyase
MATITNHDNGMPIWTDVMVQNSEQHHDLRAFFTTLFDWTWDVGGPEMGYYAIASHNGAPVLGLGQNEGSHGEITTYFKSSDIDGDVQKAVELGASVAVPAMKVSDVGTMAVLIDPTGASFGLWQAGTFGGFGVAYEENAPGWFDQVSLDPEKAGKFYASFTRHELFSPEGDMRVLRNGEQWFASITFDHVDEGPRWKPIYVVDSLERIHETVPRHGGAILIAEMPVPGSAICVFSEPVNGTSWTVMRGGEQPS